MEITKENVFKDYVSESKVVPIGIYSHRNTGIKIKVLRVSGRYIEIRSKGMTSVKDIDFLKDYNYELDGTFFH